MAEQNNNPLIGLTDEALKELEKMGLDIEESEKDLQAFEELGVDTSRLRDKVEWAKKARKLMLERFGKK